MAKNREFDFLNYHHHCEVFAERRKYSGSPQQIYKPDFG
ncbi:hypothetical protein C900_00759 [Fulvivirga imtechensis AK7]|uniref:Uncharacterized protein n=1 Tax=Fulvivirga imtechensis AK7 TaxID=1237149 RepID=L8JX92_9BACT|nr:hypothetical protein C900_00759 [Fulvivirga imtechensis AK7]